MVSDVPTYFSFPSVGPFTRDRQKNKICEGAWQMCLLLSLSQSNTFFTASAPMVSYSLISRCTTYTTLYVNLAFVSLGLLTVKILFHASALSIRTLEHHSGLSELKRPRLWICETSCLRTKVKTWQRRRWTSRGEEGMKSFFMIP